MGTTPRKPGVLFVGNFLSGAGLTPTVGVHLSKRLQAHGYPVWTTSGRMNKALRIMDMLLTIWKRRHDYGVVHLEVYSGLAFRWAEAAGCLLRWLGKPYVAALHGGALPEFAVACPARVTRLLQGAAVVTAPSPFLAKALAPYHPGILQIPNGVDLTTYSSRLRSPPAPHLIWLRSFHRIYRPELAIDVVQALSKEFPDVRLTMVGPDKDGSLGTVRARAHDLGVEDRVDLIPGIPKADVPKTLASGDIFLNTTDIDNTPVSVVEAMACGLCVVSTSVGGIPDLLENEVDALLVPKGDAPAMTAAVRRLLRDPELGSRLSEGAISKAAAYGWGAIIPVWENLIARATSSVTTENQGGAL